MIGLHAIVYSTAPEKDRQFFTDVLGLSSVDAGNGWLVFTLPPAELAVHPDDTGGTPSSTSCARTSRPPSRHFAARV